MHSQKSLIFTSSNETQPVWNPAKIKRLAIGTNKIIYIALAVFTGNGIAPIAGLTSPRKYSKGFFVLKIMDDNLKALVVDEATKLKLFAMPEELNRLDLKSLDPVSLEKCIYGQMCDGCMTARALYLQGKCANKSGLMTRLESYIIEPLAKNAALIAFLKSERETLTIDDL